MPTLHHLSTALNNYPPGIKSLFGCLNDAKATSAYFKTTAEKNNWPYHHTELLNEAASRANLIKAFQQLKATAQPGDTIIWSHSGHGTRLPAPSEFHHANPDKKHRAIVLWGDDGQTADFLLDKELSWLIWSVTNDLDVTFLCLMDCCYAGANLRNRDDKERRSDVGENHHTKALEDYLGFSDYRQVGDKKYSPPRGNYLQLAAAKPDQPALERGFTNGAQGVFTYALLTELSTCDRALSYLELFKGVSARVAGMTRYQLPQLDYSPGINARRLFLGDALAYQSSVNFLYYKTSTRQYLLNAGSIAGLKGVKEAEATVQVNGKTIPLVFESIGPSKSVVAANPDFGRKPLHVTFSNELERSMPVAFAPGFPLSKKEAFIKGLAEAAPEFIRLIDDPELVTYWICFNDQVASIYSTTDKHHFFKHNGTNNLHRFWETVDRVGRWHYIEGLNNPDTRLSGEDLKISLREYATAPDYHLDSPHRLVENRADGLQLTGKYKGTKFLCPAFSCSIRNTSNKTLYVRALVLENDYCINTEFTSNSSVLKAGEELWLSKEFNNVVTDAGGNEVMDTDGKPLKRRTPDNVIRYNTSLTLREYGITWNPESLHIVVSTDELDVTSFDQEGIPAEDTNRGQKKKGQEDKTTQDDLRGEGEDDQDDAPDDADDWAVFRIPINMMRLAWKKTNPLSKHLAGHEIRLSSRKPSFHRHLISLSAAATFFPNGLADLFSAEHDFTPYEWSSCFNRAPGNQVLFLSEFEGIEHITEQHPLRISLPREKKDTAALLKPFAWLSDGQGLVEIPHTRQDRTFNLFDFPAPMALPGFREMTRWGLNAPTEPGTGIFLLFCYLGQESI